MVAKIKWLSYSNHIEVQSHIPLMSHVTLQGYVYRTFYVFDNTSEDWKMGENMKKSDKKVHFDIQMLTLSYYFQNDSGFMISE